MQPDVATTTQALTEAQRAVFSAMEFPVQFDRILWSRHFTDAEPKAIIFAQRLATFVSNRTATEIVSDFIALAEKIQGCGTPFRHLSLNSRLDQLARLSGAIPNDEMLAFWHEVFDASGKWYEDKSPDSNWSHLTMCAIFRAALGMGDNDSPIEKPKENTADRMATPLTVEELRQGVERYKKLLQRMHPNSRAGVVDTDVISRTFVVSPEILTRGAALELIFTAADRIATPEAKVAHSEMLLSYLKLRTFEIDTSFAHRWVKNITDNIIDSGSSPEIDNARMATSAVNGFALCNDQTGILDFYCDCATSIVSPATITLLTLRIRQAPTMDFNIHDQNRKDAIAISDFSYDLREAIHKQSPWSKEVIEALVDYHDNNIDAPTLNSILQKRDIRFCEPLSQARFSELYPVSDGRKESVIDILRRLKSNSAHTITLSSCSEVEVNNATEILLQTPAEHLLNSERVCRALEKLNSYLVTAQGQPGITTSVIAHLTWTQQYVAQWIKGLSFEKILGLTHDPVLPHLLKFEELTCNHDTSYDEARWQKVAQELVTESAVTGLHALGSSALGRIVEIERALAKQGLPDVASRLYTGTIAGALVGALYNNKPETVAGARYREEILTPPWLLRTGD